jgi:excisionase family DNA binding protein
MTPPLPARAHAPQLLTVDDVAARLNVSPSTVRRLIATGELSRVSVRGAVRVSEEDLSSWVDRHRAGGFVGETDAPTSDSPTPVNLSSSPRVNAIRERLRARREKSTRERSPASSASVGAVVPIGSSKPKRP